VIDFILRVHHPRRTVGRDADTNAIAVNLHPLFTTPPIQGSIALLTLPKRDWLQQPEQQEHHSAYSWADFGLPWCTMTSLSLRFLRASRESKLLQP